MRFGPIIPPKGSVVVGRAVVVVLLAVTLHSLTVGDDKTLDLVAIT